MGIRRVTFRRITMMLLSLLAAGCSPGNRAASTGIDSTLRAELLRLGEADQAEREGFSSAVANQDTALLFRMMRGDSARTTRLRAIVAERGWPGRALAGEDGAKAAWLMLQHSPIEEFQRDMLPVLWAAAGRGDVPRSEVAMLNDRVLVRAGQPQRYGSSFFMENGRMVPHPIEDFGGLEARRAEVGMPPMQEYVRVLAEVYGTPVTWPPR